MNRRTALQQLAALAVLASPAATVLAADSAGGASFRTLPTPVPTEVQGKVEVIEFFSYGCPHCHDFEPLLERWVKALPADVNFVRVPITFNRPDWTAYAKLYVTLEALGEVNRQHAAVFAALHEDRVPLHDEAVLLEWVAKRGIDKVKFNEAWKSFGVQSRLSRLAQIAASYRVNGVPLMAVNGRYLASASTAGGYDNLLKTVDQLIVRSRG
ncbi:thioredoxin domain-containing protein [Azoarcus indigens]|uniref:Thiol:disulfide interchange protein n=1 Tax=Azoarcus indigens TaxID=29545 RepID=A0A4R6E3N3_9RHOO|nr:thiol:disulfide interchange protein DsbA/DsbL [Azoarcus indigens]NMG65559.1 thioredoxin domain-containing protein [Azoarcus indigens]TDN51438.1 thiol:disulfide interchange protein DsbA [Azoarcus indigens]